MAVKLKTALYISTGATVVTAVYLYLAANDKAPKLFGPGSLTGLSMAGFSSGFGQAVANAWGYWFPQSLYGWDVNGNLVLIQGPAGLTGALISPQAQSTANAMSAAALKASPSNPGGPQGTAAALQALQAASPMNQTNQPTTQSPQSLDGAAACCGLLGGDSNGD